MSTQSFIEKAVVIHGYEYDYSDVDYKNTSTKVIINCKLHGPFKQTPNCHLGKRRCPKCFGNVKYTNETFIKKCEEIWGENILDGYDFSLVEYVGNKIPIKIICKKHGIFSQRPDEFLHKHGCRICGGTSKLSTEEFIIKSIIVHGDRYDYSLVIYKTSHKKVKIICKKHGIFEQQPNGHLNGYGCPICKFSIGETKIKKYLDNNKINYLYQHRFDNCKHISKLVFDFYLPKNNLCIEFDGVQHHKIVEHFGGKESFKLTKIKDEIKNEYCKKNNIGLLRISYINFNNIENILKMTFNV